MRKFLQFTLSLLAMLMVSVSASAQLFKSSMPADGSTVTELSEIILEYADGQSAASAGNYFWIQGPDGEHHVTPVLETSGVTFTVSPSLTLEGTYTLSVGTGSAQFYDSWGFTFAPQTFTWTIGQNTGGGGSTGNDPLYTVAYDEEEHHLTLTWPDNTSISPTGLGSIYIDGYDQSTNFMTYDPDGDWNYNCIHAWVELPDGEYSIVITGGTYYINGNENDNMTVPFTVGNPNPDPAPTKDYTVSYANSTLSVAWPENTTVEAVDFMGTLHPTIEGYDGFVSAGMYNPSNVIEIYVDLAAGDYTLNFPAGDFTVNGTPNAAFSETFTVGGGTQGGGGDFEGEPWHETVFKAGETTVDKNNIAFNTNGVEITTVDGEFNLGGTTTKIPFGYNTYDEKELDWNNKCKFVITAKEDINKVIFVPCASAKTAIANATADKGSYSNGVWEGKLAAGETLTLTASDGIQVKEIYVCYNGDEFDPTSQEDEKGVITIQYPVENQLIEKQVDGGKFCVFTTNKEYAQVTIEVKNSNEAYDNLFKFPTRMVDNMGEKSDNLHVGENTIYAATPASGAAGKGDDWYWFKGDSYTMIVKGYVNPWDTEYDAIAEVHFVGNGKEHVAESIVKLLNITPATSFDSFGKIAMVNGVITLEFDGPVTSVTAITPGGMSDPTINHTATAKAGSDNKVWEINLGDRSGFASADTDGNPIIEVDVTATAADGIVLLSDTRADRGLELKYELVANAGPTNPVTLGDPTWSVAEGAEIEASTSSINIKFPNATNVEGTYTLEVSGTIGDKNLNLDNVSGTGTMADGADINVSLAENIGYNLFIGTITIKDANGGTVYSTEQGNFQLNFGTKDSSMGGGDNSILGEPTITADAEGITVSWPNADLEGTDADFVAFQEWTLTVNGTDYTYQPDNIDGISDGISVTIPYEKIAVYDPTVGEWGEMVPVELASGDKITITIPEGAIEVDAGWTTVYANESAITVEATVPSNEPAPTSVVLYEKGVNPEVAASVSGDSQRDLVIEGTDVTLTISNTSTSSMGKWINNAYIDNAKGGIITTNTNVMAFTSSRTIEKIEFTANKTITQKNGTSCVGTLADNVWTGEASEISIAIGENVTNISKIVVYFKADSATGINNAASVNVANDKMYNLAGQQIKVAKGIVIKNGKKMFVK